jgi:serine/threonine protein kinase
MGTPGYMSPEQADGRLRSLDARADVYALGAILFFLLHGHAPTEPSPPPAAAVPRPLAAICRRAMAHAPSRRYASAGDLGADVGLFLEGAGVSAYRETPVERVARFVGRHRVLVTLLAAYLVVRVVLALATR